MKLLSVWLGLRRIDDSTLIVFVSEITLVGADNKVSFLIDFWEC